MSFTGRRCFRFFSVLVLTLVLIGPGCANQDDAVDALLGHTEAMIGILETHRSDPARALAALETYEVENRESLEALTLRSRQIRADLGQRSKRSLQARWLERSAELRKRLQALTGRAK